MKASTNIFLSLLRDLQIPHTKSYALNVYQEHPYKYTFYGLKSLCELYGIGAEGISLEDKDEIAGLTPPFVVDYSDDYALVKELTADEVKVELYGSKFTLSLKDFKDKWNGHVLLFQPNEMSGEPNYRTNRKNLLWGKLEWTALAVSVLVMALAWLFVRPLPGMEETVLLCLSLLGITFSAMLLSQQLKIHNPLVEKVCHAFKQSSCNNVLESKAAKIFGTYSWSEIGFSYFAVNFFCLLVSGQYGPMLACVGALALPYSIWSIWYQKHIAQWCPLCLLVQAVIILQFVVYLAGGFYARPLAWAPALTLTLFSAYVLVEMALHKLLPLLNKSEELQQARWQYKHLKMKTRVFQTLLSAEKEYPISDSTIIFGPEESHLQVTVFSNPYCNPCAGMHKRLQALMDAGNCRIQYVFTAFKPEWNNINKYLIAVFLKYGPQKAWEIYSQWYDKGKYEQEKFFDSYGLDIDSEAVQKEFEQHELWREQTGLSATPTLLISNHRLPYGYVVEDMPYFT